MFRTIGLAAGLVVSAGASPAQAWGCDGHQAIAIVAERLTSSSDPVLKANALRFVVHLVGDLHQPLHTITNGDRGGNCLPVTDGGQSPQENDRQNWRPNLHGVWDAQMIRRLMEARGLADSRALAHFIEGNPRPAIRNPQSAMPRPAASRSAAPSGLPSGGVLRLSAKVPTTARVKEWARESNALGRSVAYARLPIRLPMESAAAITLESCDDNKHVGRRMAALNERITEGYEQASVPVIVSQLRLAAERLASVLKSAFP